MWRHGPAGVRTGRRRSQWRARSKPRVAAGASPEGGASATLKWWGTACQAGDGAAITSLSRRWRDHAALAALPTILSALLTVHRRFPYNQPTFSNNYY